MVNIPGWKKVIVILICLLGILYAIPNFAGESGQKWMSRHLPSWAPSKTINLGLDLQGGAHLLFSVDIKSVIKEQRDNLFTNILSVLRENDIRREKIEKIKNGVEFSLKSPDQAESARRLIRQSDERLNVFEIDKNTTRVTFSQNALDDIVNKTIAQSIEVIRRRIDETGTREPVIQRQGEDRILVQLPGVKNPDRIKSLIGQTAKLTFHLVLADAQSGRGGFVLPMADQPSRKLKLERRPTLTGDMLTNAAPSFSQTGQPVVTFRLDSLGARRFCKLTKEHTNEPFAIVLDQEIISAPNINEPICAGSAQISGNFTVQETADLALLLRAGALPADLEIVEERTVGPSLGKDSVEAGKNASIYAMIFVLIFMGLSYRLFGVFANIALLVNVALIMALLSALQATLTLPGIAGIVLTIGMAVDANVLIFERIKEEIRAGRSVINAVDAGYSRAMTTIIDSNLTTLIAAIILYSFGSGPIKGFAVTLGIGIATSFFSAIMVTRLMVVTWLREKKPSSLSI